MHIAASSPMSITREEIPQQTLEREKEIYADQARQSGKPENIIDKIVEGRLSKYYSEVCLLEQTYIRNGDKTVRNLIQEAISLLGENIVIKRFELFILGQ